MVILTFDRPTVNPTNNAHRIYIFCPIHHMKHLFKTRRLKCTFLSLWSILWCSMVMSCRVNFDTCPKRASYFVFAQQEYLFLCALAWDRRSLWYHARRRAWRYSFDISDRKQQNRRWYWSLKMCACLLFVWPLSLFNSHCLFVLFCLFVFVLHKITCMSSLSYCCSFGVLSYLGTFFYKFKSANVLNVYFLTWSNWTMHLECTR